MTKTQHSPVLWLSIPLLRVFYSPDEHTCHSLLADIEQWSASLPTFTIAKDLLHAILRLPEDVQLVGAIIDYNNVRIGIYLSGNVPDSPAVIAEYEGRWPDTKFIGFKPGGKL